MSDPASDAPPAQGEPDPNQHSVLDQIAHRTGEAPRITLRDEDSAGAASPVIDPRSQEKFALPQGRGTYQLMGEVARGGMGVILKGHDTDLGRDVALKVLDKRLAERPEVVQRFVEEAQIGGQLQHPGIVPVYELGLMADQRPYFTMKLVKGRTLANLLAERESPASGRARMIDIFESICQTMAYAHSRGVLHRDLKPANIMVGAFGEVQVVDWGLAKVLARGGTADEKRARDRLAESQLTVLETVRSAEGSGSGSESMVGSVMGTPAYMPPEQASGKVDRLDERADVFALGAILCEILTGRPPYVGDRSDVIIAAAQGDQDEALARLEACGADPELVKLTKQCLMPAAEARPANASVVADRIHSHVVGVEERAHAAQVEAAAAQGRAQQERKARRLTAALGVAGLAIVLVAGGGWAWVQNERAQQQQVEAQRERDLAGRQRELAEEIHAELAIASQLQGGERWDEAIAAAGRARALAQGGEAGPELIATVDATLATLRDAVAEAERRASRDAERQQLLADLDAVRAPDYQDMEELDAIVARGFGEVFRAHGLDLDAVEPAEAAAALTARGLGSEIALVLDAWGDARRRTGDEAGALRMLEVAHLVDPDPQRADLREALENGDLEMLGRLAEAEIDDQPAATIELLAAGLLRLGERNLALQVFRRGRELHPDDFALHYELGRMLTPSPLDFGPEPELVEALGCYRAALALEPDNYAVRFLLGRIYDKLGQKRLALEQHEINLERRPDDPVLRFHQGFLTRDVGEPERALAILETLFEVEHPEWVPQWSYNSAGQACLDLGDVDRALEYYAKAVERGPGVPQFHSGLLEATMASGNPAEVERALKEGLALMHSNASYLNNAAWFLATGEFIGQRDPEAAVGYAERAAAIDPGNSNNWNTLGVARYYAGDMGGAVEALLESMRRSGGGQVYDWIFLAMAYHGLGDARSAEFWYRSSIRWMDEHSGEYDVEFNVYRDEAEALLGG